MDSGASLVSAERLKHLALKAGYRAHKALALQCCEQLGKRERPVIVKVGANDGITSDLLADVVLRAVNWIGLLIEPVPYLFEMLKANYGARFAFENIAIGASGEREFYYVSPEAVERFKLPSWVGGLGSFDRGHIVRHLARKGIGGHDKALIPYIVTETVRVEPLADVAARRGIAHIDLLHIDTEGHDYEVLKSLGTDIVPDVVLIEHEHVPDKDALAAHLLQTHDVFDCGSDYLAVSRIVPC